MKSDGMAEWSKAVHLSCPLFGGEGSNPSTVIFINKLTATLKEFNFWLIEKFRKQGGAVVACWAHNPKVDGSKPSPAILCF